MKSEKPEVNEMVLLVMRIAELLMTTGDQALDNAQNEPAKTQDSQPDVKCDEIKDNQQ